MTQEEEAGSLPAFLTSPRGVLRRRWPWIAGGSAIGVVATALYVSSIPVTYLASATLLVSDQKISDAFVPNTAVEDPIQQIDALISEILSRERLAPLVEKHNLYPELRTSTGMLDLVGMARANVSVAPADTVVGGSASVFVISFVHGDPQIAAAMANDLATLFTAAASRISGAAAQLTTDFMRAELERSERELRENERQLSEFKTRYRGELPTELGANTSKLERLALQRQTLVSQLETAETRLADMEQLGDLANPSSPYARLTALRSKLVSELAVNTEEHPNVIATKRQIEALEKEVAGGASSSGDPAHDIALRTARDVVVDLKLELGRTASDAFALEARVARTPEREEELAGLTQKMAVLQETYVTNLRKLQAAELSQSVESAQQGARVEVIDRAVAPSAPERTRLKYLLAGLAASLMAGLGLAVAFELLDPVIVSAKQLEDELGLQVLGSIGRIG